MDTRDLIKQGEELAKQQGVLMQDYFRFIADQDVGNAIVLAGEIEKLCRLLDKIKDQTAAVLQGSKPNGNCPVPYRGHKGS